MCVPKGWIWKQNCSKHGWVFRKYRSKTAINMFLSQKTAIKVAIFSRVSYKGQLLLITFFLLSLHWMHHHQNLISNQIIKVFG